MPHIIIEHSTAVSDDQALKIGIAVRDIMAKIQEGNFDPEQFKIRTVSYEHFAIGAEDLGQYSSMKNGGNSAFIHISIKILAGRSAKVRKDVACRVLEFAKNSYDALNLLQKRCDISVDVIEMDREIYQKITILK